jgi:thymidylate kinase
MTAKLLDSLVRALNQENLKYCHWKSNYSIDDTLSGETDLDLLIDRKSLSKISIILLEFGFKSARMKSGINPDGIFHYYGLDESTGKLFHVHLYSSILTGESYVKTHLLPFENLLLENTSNIGTIKIASSAAELLVFVIRTFIKYGSLLDVLMMAGKAESLRDELTWLQNESDLAESLALLKKYCPVIKETLFLECLNALKKNVSLPKRILIAKKVRHHLQVYQKYCLPSLISAYSQFLWEKTQSLINRRRKNKNFYTGGMVIAIVGAEATGKSTLVFETGNWLGQVFSIRTIHAGKPPSTWMTAPFNVLLPVFRRFFPMFRTTRQEVRMNESKKILLATPVTNSWSGLFYAIRSVSIAWDRRHLLVQARYHATNGDIVICDRYPSENISAMDSPRLKENIELEGLKNVLYNWLARLEGRFYREIPPPDLVIRLKVSMEIARQRNRDRIKPDKETDAYLEARHLQNREWCKSGTKYIYEINTDESLPNTILAVKRTIWEVI